jgi:hypothetical protein
MLIIFMSVALLMVYRAEILQEECMEDVIMAIKKKLRIKTLKRLS